MGSPGLNDLSNGQVVSSFVLIFVLCLSHCPCSLALIRAHPNEGRTETT